MVEIDLLRMRHCSFSFHDFCEELQLIEQRAEMREVVRECFRLKPQIVSWERLMMGSAWVA
jgi:hypothetical protein